MKVAIQVFDTNTGIYQCGVIDEPVMAGKEIINALSHFGIRDVEVKWKDSTSMIGSVEGTSKMVSCMLAKE